MNARKRFTATCSAATSATFSYDITQEDFDWGQWKQICVVDPDGYGIAFGAANKNAAE
ncbi:MAG: hypothetical protein WCC10_04915 [Tumebacillaceae bacterium]